tara:strand:- start:539 stop:1084 length:546 start_codon:yes stop_codon:yes gene_type:complete
MNSYCNYLNFPHIDIDLSIYKKNKRNQIRVIKDIMGVELNDILHKLNIDIQWVEVFYLGFDSDHTIHCDGHELDNKAKLNYIVGGKDSVMTWYKPVSEDKIEKRTSPANTIYLSINKEDVIATYNTEMKKGFYLVNVGEFHNVWNKNEDRYCLSACLIDSRTSYRLNFNELQQRLKDYINE